MATWITCAIIVMFLLACVLWIIDIRSFVAEIQATFLDATSEEPLASRYAKAQLHGIKLLGVINVIYAYMVCTIFQPLSTPSLSLTVGHWRRHHRLTGLCLLEQVWGEMGSYLSLRLSLWIYQYVARQGPVHFI